jgi:hypothetical protein
VATLKVKYSNIHQPELVYSSISYSIIRNS